MKMVLIACEIMFSLLAFVFLAAGMTFSAVMMLFLVFWAMLEHRYLSLAEQIRTTRSELHRLYKIIVSFNERKDQ